MYHTSECKVHALLHLTMTSTMLLLKTSTYYLFFYDINGLRKLTYKYLSCKISTRLWLSDLLWSLVNMIADKRRVPDSTQSLYNDLPLDKIHQNVMLSLNFYFCF